MTTTEMFLLTTNSCSSYWSSCSQFPSAEAVSSIGERCSSIFQRSRDQSAIISSCSFGICWSITAAKCFLKTNTWNTKMEMELFWWMWYRFVYYQLLQYFLQLIRNHLQQLSPSKFRKYFFLSWWEEKSKHNFRVPYWKVCSLFSFVPYTDILILTCKMLTTIKIVSFY